MGILTVESVDTATHAPTMMPNAFGVDAGWARGPGVLGALLVAWGVLH